MDPAEDQAQSQEESSGMVSAPVSSAATEAESSTMAPEPPTATTEDDEHRPKVGFGRIEVREYARCLGNNPATTHGPSLSLGWAYNIAGSFDVEEYEKARPPRRVTNQMLVPGSVRESILLDQANVTKKQIQAVEKEIKAARQRRQLTVAMQEFENWHVAGEFVKRRYRRFKSGISKKKEQEMLWENAAKVSKKKSTTSKSSDPAYDSDCDSSTVSDSAYITQEPAAVAAPA